MMIRATLVTLAVSFGFASCGGDSESTTNNTSGPAESTSADDSDEGSAPAPATVMDWDASKATAGISGMVKFEGDTPKRRKVDMGSDAACSEAHDSPPLDESAIVGDNGGLQNVFVYVKSGLEGWKFQTPTEPVVLDQQGCTYLPHVFGVQVGQPVTVKNSDPVTHNVHSYAKKNDSFNKSQATNTDFETIFDRKEVLVTLKCDIHGWMNSYAGVTEHPFFAVSGADGSFDLGKLPPGEYTIEAVHEVFGKEKAKVTVADGGAETVEFTFSE